MNLRSRPLESLIAECRADSAKFRQGLKPAGAACFELFRRAICDRDSQSWETIIGLYRPQVVRWVRQHPGWQRVRVLDHPDDHWTGAAFTRMAAALRRPERFERFGSISQLLQYLKSAVHSAVMDELRQLDRAGLAQTWSLPDDQDRASTIGDPSQNPEREIIQRMEEQALKQAIRAICNDEADRVIVQEYWEQHLRPRQVFERHPDLFTTVFDVYRVARNLRDRLRRMMDR